MKLKSHTTARAVAMVHEAVRSLLDAHVPLDTVDKLVKVTTVKIALEQSNWNQRKAGQILGVHRNTVNRLIAGLGIARPDGKKTEAVGCATGTATDSDRRKRNVAPGEARGFSQRGHY